MSEYFQPYTKIDIVLPSGVVRKARTYKNGSVWWTAYMEGKYVLIRGTIVNGIFTAASAVHQKYLEEYIPKKFPIEASTQTEYYNTRETRKGKPITAWSPYVVTPDGLRKINLATLSVSFRGKPHKVVPNYKKNYFMFDEKAVA